MSVLRAGKVPPQILKQYVFPFLGAADSDVIHGPGIGRDAALIRIGRKIAVATTDPITGAIQKIGSYVIHICANDIATFGITPRWFLATILLPETFEAPMLKEIMSSMHSTAESLKISIIGGHTEITQGIMRPIIIGFMLGITEKNRYVTSSGAQPGDVLILTKGAAIEGTAILATERAEGLQKRLGKPLVKRAQNFLTQISVVPEALKAMSTNAVTAMHDPTEGGIANGLHELADASNVGFIINRQNLMIYKETQLICQQFDIDPLNLIASGAMLIAVKAKKVNVVLQTLEDSGISASQIGHLVKDATFRRIIEPNGSESIFPQPANDALWAALSKPLD